MFPIKNILLYLSMQRKVHYKINFNWGFSLSATIDVKKTIFDLCTDVTDSFVAVIEVSFQRSSQQYLNYSCMT